MPAGQTAHRRFLRNRLADLHAARTHPGRPRQGPRPPEAYGRLPAPMRLARCCCGRQHPCCQHLRAAHDAGSRQYTGGSQHHAPTPQTLGIRHAASLWCSAVRFVIGLCGSDILGKPYSSILIKTQKSDRRTRLLAGLRPREARFSHAGIITMLELTSAKKTSTALRFSCFSFLASNFFSKARKTIGALPLL